MFVAPAADDAEALSGADFEPIAGHMVVARAVADNLSRGAVLAKVEGLQRTAHGRYQSHHFIGGSEYGLNGVNVVRRHQHERNELVGHDNHARQNEGR